VAVAVAAHVLTFRFTVVAAVLAATLFLRGLSLVVMLG
jgi:hypothetical protein